MINREQWAEIYDWARHNGLSPVDFLVQGMHSAQMSVTGNAKDEEMIYHACRQFSINRTKYPSVSTTASRLDDPKEVIRDQL